MPIKDSEIQSSIEVHFTAIFEQSPLSIQIMSPDGYTVWVNKAWEGLWGVTLEQIAGYNILEDKQLVKNGVMPYVKRAFAGEFAEIPPVFYDPNETVSGVTSNAQPQRCTKAIIYPIKNLDGEVQKVVLLHEDITNQILTEEKTKASETRSRISLMEEFRHTWAERLEAVREDERRRLSHQLHDDIVQQLAVASIKLLQLEKRLVKLLPEENAVFSELVMAQELLRRNQQSLRHMAHVLHSGVLEQFGLIEAFRKFTKNIDILLKEQSINFSLDLCPNFPRLEPIVEKGIYRTVQEAVVNALKHSHAELISLSLSIKNDLALVVIKDNGCGFDTEKNENGGIGFANMYDRAEIIGAKLDVASETGRGTIITLEVPLEESRRKA